MKIKIPSTRVLLSISCLLTLLGLLLCIWSLFDPRPIPVIVAMSAAQGVGMLAFLIFAFVIFSDLWRARVLRREKR